MKIYKYQLQVTDEQLLEIPKYSKFLSLQVQYGKPCVWFLVDETSKEDEWIKFITIGTGQQAYGISYYTFLGTYQLLEGNLVYHVWAGL